MTIIYFVYIKNCKILAELHFSSLILLHNYCANFSTHLYVCHKICFNFSVPGTNPIPVLGGFSVESSPDKKRNISLYWKVCVKICVFAVQQTRVVRTCKVIKKKEYGFGRAFGPTE